MNHRHHAPTPIYDRLAAEFDFTGTPIATDHDLDPDEYQARYITHSYFSEGVEYTSFYDRLSGLIFTTENHPIAPPRMGH